MLKGIDTRSRMDWCIEVRVHVRLPKMVDKHRTVTVESDRRPAEIACCIGASVVPVTLDVLGDEVFLKRLQ